MTYIYRNVLETQSPSVVERNVPITMRDGVVIMVDIYRPVGDGPFPALYAVSPYNKDLASLPPIPAFRSREAGNIGRWVDQGYAFIHADVRGTGQSLEGQFLFSSKEEQYDMYDTIEWIAAQTWSNGKVGMIGESYYGGPQWLAAATQPPHLTCIVPYDAFFDMYRDGIYHGGICSIGFMGWWTFKTSSLTYLEHAPGLRGDLAGVQIPGLVLNNRLFGEFWEERSAFAKAAQIKTPFYSISNWMQAGLHLRGNLLAFESIDAPKKLLITGGNNHQSSLEVFHSDEVHDELTRWYDYWLKGIDTGIMDEPTVKIWTNNKGYYTANSWPPRDVEHKRLYLSDTRADAMASLNDGSLSWDAPVTANAATAFPYPHPQWGGWPGFGTAIPTECGEMDPVAAICTFTSPPLDEAVEVTGPIVLTLYVSSDQVDADVIVKLYDFDPDGKYNIYRPVSRGWLKASHRALDPARSTPDRPFHPHDREEPLEPGTIYELAIEILPTSHLFGKGHRLALHIANGDSPVFDMPFSHHYGSKIGTEHYHHDRQYPSHLLLPVRSVAE